MHIGCSALRAFVLGPRGEAKGELQSWKVIGETGRKIPTFSLPSPFVADLNFSLRLPVLGRCSGCRPGSVSTVFEDPPACVGGTSTKCYHIAVGEQNEDLRPGVVWVQPATPGGVPFGSPMFLSVGDHSKISPLAGQTKRNKPESVTLG